VAGHRTEWQGGDTAAKNATCGKRNVLLYVPRLSPRRQDMALFVILLTRWMSRRSIYTGTTEIHPDADPSLQTLGIPRADGVTEPKAGWER